MDPRHLASLIDRAKRHDPAAFDALVEGFGPRLYGYLYRLTGGREDAEDLLQELFVRLVRTIGGYKHDGKFEGWLFRIATNLARDRVRRKRHGPVIVSLDGDRAEAADTGGGSAAELADLSGPPPEARLELSEDADALQRALAQLPAAEREVLMLRHFAGMSFAEISEAMGTPLGTALARAHRGLNRLRILMKEAA